MKLRDYLSLHAIPMAKFGVRIGRSHTVVSRLCSGKSSPSMALMATIERVTNGDVQARDFYPSSGHDGGPEGNSKHRASPEHRDDSAPNLAAAAIGSSRSISGDFPADREHIGHCQNFHEIEPPTLKQAVFETGLKEALGQPTKAEQLAALDRLEAQVRRRVA